MYEQNNFTVFLKVQSYIFDTHFLKNKERAKCVYFSTNGVYDVFSSQNIHTLPWYDLIFPISNKCDKFYTGFYVVV